MTGKYDLDRGAGGVNATRIAIHADAEVAEVGVGAEPELVGEERHLLARDEVDIEKN